MARQIRFSRGVLALIAVLFALVGLWYGTTKRETPRVTPSSSSGDLVADDRLQAEGSLRPRPMPVGTEGRDPLVDVGTGSAAASFLGVAPRVVAGKPAEVVRGGNGPAAIEALPYRADANIGPVSAAWSDRLALNKVGGPLRATRTSIDRARRWLEVHQRPDGSWSSDDAEAWCSGTYSGTRKSEEEHEADVAVTAMGLLTFLGTGSGAREAEGASTARTRAASYLLAHQNKDGSFSLAGLPVAWSTDVVCAVALMEITNVGFDPRYGAAARNALEWIASATETARATRDVGDLDVTSWLALALHETRYARVFSGARVGLLIAADSPLVAALASIVGRVPSVETGTPQVPDPAASLFRLLVLSGTDAPEATVTRYVNDLVRSPPSWGIGSSGPSIDGWFFADLALLSEAYGWHHQTYDRVERWSRWREAMIKALDSNQRAGGEACGVEGSWDAVGAQGLVYGRAGVTCLCALALDAVDSQGRMFYP